MQPQFQNVAITVGLVVLGLLGLVVVWKITKSLVKLVLWSAVLLLLGLGVFWLLGQAGVVPRAENFLAPPPRP